MSSDVPAKTPMWKKKPFWIAVAVVFAVGGIGNAIKGTPMPTPAPAPAPQSAATRQSTPDADSSESTTKPKDVTSGGIDYGIAVQACDKAAQEEMYPGADYAPAPILGMQKGQVGLSDDQYLAVYNVKVDGRTTAISCLVDGTKEEPHVISINEVPAT